jgi:ubiquinone/menaquinone biosynthesis C-methylase UbiE
MNGMSKTNPPGAGKSSFDLVDTARLFDEAGLGHGMTFLDLACGRGEYALAAAGKVGKEGVVYAVDLWEEGIAALKGQAFERGFRNVEARVADVGKGIPLEDACVDVCLVATVLHDLVQEGAADQALREVSRVLRPGGLLAVMEFKKIEGPPGPPLRIRLSEDDVRGLVFPHGFEERRVVEVGPYNYLMTFEINKG